LSQATCYFLIWQSFWQINASLGYYEIITAGDVVAALKKSSKHLATAKKRDEKWSNIDAGTVVFGDLVL
jgi:magnesium-transporting ATPase (P-type)